MADPGYSWRSRPLREPPQRIGNPLLYATGSVLDLRDIAYYWMNNRCLQERCDRDLAGLRYLGQITYTQYGDPPDVGSDTRGIEDEESRSERTASVSATPDSNPDANGIEREQPRSESGYEITFSTTPTPLEPIRLRWRMPEAMFLSLSNVPFRSSTNPVGDPFELDVYVEDATREIFCQRESKGKLETFKATFYVTHTAAELFSGLYLKRCDTLPCATPLEPCNLWAKVMTEVYHAARRNDPHEVMRRYTKMTVSADLDHDVVCYFEEVFDGVDENAPLKWRIHKAGALPETIPFHHGKTVDYRLYILNNDYYLYDEGDGSWMKLKNHRVSMVSHVRAQLERERGRSQENLQWYGPLNAKSYS